MLNRLLLASSNVLLTYLYLNVGRNSPYIGVHVSRYNRLNIPLCYFLINIYYTFLISIKVSTS